MTAEELEVVEDYPKKYKTNTKHEKAALDLAENYRLQYENLFPSRSPLFIAPKNEAGIEKVISTFVQVDLWKSNKFNLFVSSPLYCNSKIFIIGTKWQIS